MTWQDKRASPSTDVSRVENGVGTHAHHALLHFRGIVRETRDHTPRPLPHHARVSNRRYASSAGQALDEDLRQAGNEVSDGGETRNDLQISELTVYFTVAVGSGRLSIVPFLIDG